MSKHTPAPWVVDDSVHGPGNGIIHIRANEPFERDICTVWRSSLEKPEQHDGNARLIAAAPDMLEALIGAVDFLGGVDGASAIRSRLFAAIAKAEGR